MINSKPKRVDLDRIERAYLASLRVAILGVATLCLIGAFFFGVNAAWRLFVSTEVVEESVQVTGAQVAAELRKATPERDRSGESDTIPASVRQAHATWVRDIFPKYYAVYHSSAQAYNKPEDEILSAQQLIEALGYDINALFEDSPKASAFVFNAEYQSQAISALTAAMRDPAVVAQLSEYKAAEKTAQSCSTTYQSRTVWDPYSTACYGWYEYPQGCQVQRSVPVERCIPAYPDGIVSPRVAFGRADEEFFRLWAQQTDQMAAEAQAARDEREATRAQIGPNLLLALQVLGAFLVVMFFFLMVAIERHLRSVGIRTVGGPETPQNAGLESQSVQGPLIGSEGDPEPDPPLTPQWARRR